MRNAPPTPPEQINDIAADNFGKRFTDLEFVPIGETGWLYKAYDEQGEPYALKIQNEPDPAIAATSEYLQKHNWPWMPPLILDKQDEMWVRSGDYSYSIQKFVQTERSFAWDEQVSPEFLVDVGKMLRDLHDVPASDELAQKLPVETFRYLLLDKAIDAVAKVSAMVPTDEAAERMKKVITDNSGTFDELCRYSIELGDQLRSKPEKLVITHGDVHFANILAPANDHIYLIDWDSTMLALPEHDLMYFNNQQLRDIAVGYGQDRPFDPVAIEYYRAALTLRTMWFWPTKILEATDVQERLHAAEHMEWAFQPGNVVERSFDKYTA